jgi:hypothetical protein
MRTSTRQLPPATVPALLTLLLLAVVPALDARAGGLGLPTSRAGLGLGNLREFTGVRLNIEDQGVQRVNGINVTLWAPMVNFGHGKDEDEDEARSKRRNGTYNGLGLNLIGGSGERMNGVHVGLLGLELKDRGTGIFAGGLGVGAGNLTGLALGGLGVGSDDMTGIAIGGLGVGGDNLTGIAIGGLGIGGENLTGVFTSALGIGARTLRGVAFSGGIATTESRGAALATVYHRTEKLHGVATGLYNRADHAEGLMVGVFNRAETLRGVQIGLLNHVGSGPAAARWLPLINARF